MWQIHCYLPPLMLILITIISIEARVFRIGYLSGSKRPPRNYRYHRPGFQISGAISLAVHQINEHHPDHLLENHTLEFDYAETYGLEDESIKQTAAFLFNNVSAIVGPQDTCFHESRMASTFNTLMLGYYCQQSFKTADNEAQYSTFVNVNPPAAQISRSVLSLLLKYNWRKVTIIYNVEDEPHRRTGESIRDILQDNGIQILQTKTYPKHHYVLPQGLENDEDSPHKINPFVEIVKESKDSTRIYVLVADQRDVDSPVAFMNAMESNQLLDSGDYFVVGAYISQYEPEQPGLYMRGFFEDSVTKTSIKGFRSFLGVITTPPKAEFREFNKEVNHWLSQPPFNFEWDKTEKKVLPQAAYLHDAVFLYAKALHECLNNFPDCPDPLDGRKLYKYIVDKQYSSVMGYDGYIDADGEAHGNYSLLAMREHISTGKRSTVGLADIGIFLLNNNRSQLPTLTFKTNEDIHWPHGRIPSDEPDCGFDGLKCKEPAYRDRFTLIIAGSVVAALVFIGGGGLCYRRMAYEKALASVLWKIEWNDLHVSDVMAYLRNSSDPDFDQTASLSSLAKIIDFSYTELRLTNMHTELGLHKRQVVAVKRIKKRNVDLSRREIQKELKTMRELHNDNLCGFIGACVDPVVAIVTEFCQRGSLKDILNDENCALDDMFLSSLVTDLVKGMCYIHLSPLKSHGSLKSTNCLVDSRFVLKITDYGLHEFKRKNSDHSTHRGDDVTFYSRMLWTAPELLRVHYPPPAGTQNGDVYSFAIILFEIYGRSGPFGETSLSPRDIIMNLRTEPNGPDPFRPPVQRLPSTVPEFVVNLMVEAWNENPWVRPNFQTIKQRLAPFQRGMKSNIMDNVMALLQRYAVNLEAIVGERTLQLQEEKKKTETLLYEILPRPVAEHLIREEKVEAEQFECVTIFFSDIVGFTSLSADSTPLEVVAFLNDLYTLFDSLLEQYDAYKVETIGDSYMVCSGLPIRNGDRHAGVIASFSLHLMDAIKSFRIAHRPHQPMLLRVGIHSGPVVAGVVGLKMPRYCLFGDTVNTASRCESTGEAQKIHCSPQSQQILEDLGGYYLEPRGMVYMKGKGEQLTYWLADEDDRIKQQRQQPNLSSLHKASPILGMAKWGSVIHPKRRLSILRNNRLSSSPTCSPAQSRHKLNSESTFGGCSTIGEDNGSICNGNLKGSLPNLLKSISTNIASQCVGYQNGDVSAGMPLLYDQDYIRSETRSANCSRTGSYEMLSVPENSILVLSNC